MSIRTAFFAAVALVAVPASAQQKTDLPIVSAFDLFVEAKPYQGRTVKVTGCVFYNSASSWTNCGVLSPKNDKQVGSLLVQMRTADGELRRKLLTDCAGDEPSEDCVFDLVARINFSRLEIVELQRAKIAP